MQTAHVGAVRDSLSGAPGRSPDSAPAQRSLNAIGQSERFWLSTRVLHAGLGLLSVAVRWGDHRRPRAAALAYGMVACEAGWLVRHIRHGGRLSDRSVLVAETVAVAGAAAIRPVLYDIEDASLDMLGLVPLFGVAGLAGFQRPSRAAPGLAAAIGIELWRAATGPRHLQGRHLGTAVGHVVFAGNAAAGVLVIRSAESRNVEMWAETERLARQSGERQADSEGRLLMERTVVATGNLLTALSLTSSSRSSSRTPQLTERSTEQMAAVDSARSELVAVLEGWEDGAMRRPRPEPPLREPLVVTPSAEKWLFRLMTSVRVLNSAMLGLNARSSRSALDRPGDLYRLSAAATVMGAVAGRCRHPAVGAGVHTLAVLLAAGRESQLRRRPDVMIALGALPTLAIVESMSSSGLRWRLWAASAQAVGLGLWARRSRGRPSPSPAEVTVAVAHIVGSWIVGLGAARMYRQVTKELEDSAVALAAVRSEAARLHRHERRASVVHNRLKNATDLYLAGLLDSGELASALESALRALKVGDRRQVVTVGELARERVDAASFLDVDLRIDEVAAVVELGESSSDLALVIEELLLNAARHGADGRARVVINRIDGGIDVVVSNRCTAVATPLPNLGVSDRSVSADPQHRRMDDVGVRPKLPAAAPGPGGGQPSFGLDGGQPPVGRGSGLAAQRALHWGGTVRWRQSRERVIVTVRWPA